MLTVSSPSAVAKEDINVPQVSSGDKSGKLQLKKGERERERERLWYYWYVKWEEQMLHFES